MKKILSMRKLTKTEIKTLTVRQFRVLRLRFLDDLFHLAEDVEKPDDLFLIRILEEARWLEILINKSTVSGSIEPVKVELNSQSTNETIEKKAVFIQTLKETSGNEKESLRRAELDKLTALNMAANDAAFRGAWESM